MDKFYFGVFMQVKKKRQAILKELEERKDGSIYDIEYNMDETDREILLYLNQEYPWVDEDIYELTMDRLEKENHYLQRIALTKIPENEELSEECNICGDKETENDNFLVFCDGCNIAVHQSCYGIPNIPEGSWLCRPCLLSPKKIISCILCPVSGGAYKRTSNGFWCHVLCGLLVPEARFENVSLVEPVDIEDVHRSQQQCIECSTKKGGVVPCSYYGCRRYYHASCAANTHKYIDISNCIIFCHEHDPQKKAENILTRSPDSNYPILENPVTIRKSIPLWIPQRRIHLEIENVPVRVSDYVINRIVERDIKEETKRIKREDRKIKKEPRRSACEYIKKMYAVWQIRKKDRPIIKRLRIDAVPDGFQGWGNRKKEIAGQGEHGTSQDKNSTGNNEHNNTDSNEHDTDSTTDYDKLDSTGSTCATESGYSLAARVSSSAYSLPDEIVLTEMDRFLYRRAIEGSYAMKMALIAVEEEEYAVKKRILELENEKNKIFSNYIPGYQNISVLLEDLLLTDKHGLFREDITDDIAPGYSSIIQNPISFDVIERRASSLMYKSFEEIVKDVDLLISNAYKYNGRDSFIGIEAERLEEVISPWKIKQNEILIGRVFPNPYLPYILTKVDKKGSKDSIVVRDIITEEIHFIERRSAVRISSRKEIRRKLQDLNKITGITQEQERVQIEYIKRVDG